MLNCLKWITEHMQYNTKSPKLSYCLNFSHHLSGTPLLLEHIAIALSIFWLQILGHHHVIATLKDEPSGLWTPYDSDHSKQSCTKKNVLLVPWELETTQLLRREWEREWAYMKPQRQLITPSTWSDLLWEQWPALRTVSVTAYQVLGDQSVVTVPPASRPPI